MKTIVILSTEPWGKMLLSKMHYAIELAEMGHKVYFVNPPESSASKGLASVHPDKIVNNLTVVNTKAIKSSLFFRHKLFFIYEKISEAYVKAIQKIVGGGIDEVWCFDPHLYINLRKFKAVKTILLLYDFYKGKHVFRAAETADALATVSQVILDHYEKASPPKLLLQHGLGNHFASIAANILKGENFVSKQGEKVKIGYMGNLLREGMNIPVAKQIIEQNSDKEFHFWGPYSLNENNVINKMAVVSEECLSFVDFLKSQTNVFLYGVKNQRDLAIELNKMDAFLFLYSSKLDMNKASNSHKILEYLSTGKVTISTYVSNYRGSDLLMMCKEADEDSLPSLVKEVTGNLAKFNSPAQQKQRIAFALSNSYKKQIERIQQFIHEDRRGK